MKNVYIDDARQLKFYFRINRAFQKDFVFYEKPDEGADPSVPFDIASGMTFRIEVKKNPGDRKNVLVYTTSGGGLSFPSYQDNVLRWTGTQSQTRIEEGEYFVDVIRTDVNKSWLNGWAYFSFGPTDSADNTSTDILIDESGTALTVVVQNEEITDDDIISALGYTPAKQIIQVACSDETTALTAGTGKITFRMPHAMTVSAVRASLTTAQTSGSILTVDINEGGTTILSTKLTVDNGEKTSTTAATPVVISDTALADDAEITIDIDQIGDGTAKGLKITLIGS